MIKKIKDSKKTKNEKVEDVIPEVKHHSKIDVNLNTSDHANLKELVEKNIKWSQVIYEQNKKIKRRMTWMVIGNYLRLALIVVPIILAVFYLPPLLKSLFGQYQSILGGVGSSSSQINELLGEASSSQLQEILKTFGSR
ncbi:MAG: hypothetical protein HOA57_00745 [Candidatus Magasanikbacteria bacterium]|jgi:hypothetical protein|nr:hypothetical protein [Candidatus Magasanikbacteria bacterium]MBT4314605.1 hypothetical protein [Candidatus Magasanikbacteria bacterium]MBT4546967.1 hypothetical protein [Candidatus Magasanikbacteria bacterium]MBT6818900.1 hypothetical protein [Candidatus Magasanikbacteria bacterium]